MLGPGEYVPDVTEGITSVEDLPEPRLERRSRSYPARRCPHCGRRARRYSVGSRTLHDLGDTRAGRPVDLVVTYSQHYCRFCDCHFAVDLSDLAWPKCHYTRRVQELAVRVVAEDGLAYQAASWRLWRDHRVFVPSASIQNWVEAAGGKKGRQHLDHLPRQGAGRFLRLSGHRRDVRRAILRAQRGGQSPLQPLGLPRPGALPQPRGHPRIPERVQGATG